MGWRRPRPRWSVLLRPLPRPPSNALTGDIEETDVAGSVDELLRDDVLAVLKVAQAGEGGGCGARAGGQRGESGGGEVRSPVAGLV